MKLSLFYFFSVYKKYIVRIIPDDNNEYVKFENGLMENNSDVSMNSGFGSKRIKKT